MVNADRVAELVDRVVDSFSVAAMSGCLAEAADSDILAMLRRLAPAKRFVTVKALLDSGSMVRNFVLTLLFCIR